MKKHEPCLATQQQQALTTGTKAGNVHFIHNVPSECGHEKPTGASLTTQVQFALLSGTSQTKREQVRWPSRARSDTCPINISDWTWTKIDLARSPRLYRDVEYGRSFTLAMDDAQHKTNHHSYFNLNNVRYSFACTGMRWFFLLLLLLPLPLWVARRMVGCCCFVFVFSRDGLYGLLGTRKEVVKTARTDG